MAAGSRERRPSVPTGKRKKASQGSGEKLASAAAPKAEEVLDKQGVFIRGLPSGATDKDIQTLLESSIGPTSTCFVIRDDYGVARFRNEEDANRCIEELQGIQLHGSALRFEAAKPKRKAPKDADKAVPKKRPGRGAEAGKRDSSAAKKQRDAEDQQDEEDEDEDDDNTAAAKQVSSSSTSAKRTNGGVYFRTLIVRGLGKSIAKDRISRWLEDKMPTGTAIESVKRVLDSSGSDDCEFQVTFAKESAARRAVGVLQGEHLDGRQVSVALRAMEKGMVTSKAGRLIVRNLAFGATEKHIRKAFEALGALKEVHLPPAPPGSKNPHKGFAFVQYKDTSLAAKAVADLNGIKICGRGVAVDYSVDAMLYNTLQKQEQEQQRRTASNLVGKADDEDDVVLETVPMHHAKAEAGKDKKKKKKAQEEEEEAEEDDGKADGGDADMAVEKKEEGEEGEDEDEVNRMKRLMADEFKATQDKTEKKKQALPKRKPGFDLDQRCTIFVRNVPFDATEEDLSDVFRKFGPLKSVKLVMDKQGQNAHAGKAFIQYREQAGHAAALADEARAEKKLKEMGSLLKRRGDQQPELPALEGFGITLKGRRLVVKDALKPEEAEKIVEAKQNKKKAKAEEKEMWLHLLHMGEIKEGSQQWQQLSKSEQEQRKASAKERKFRSTNPNFAIHPQRLSIRNLPKSVDATRLRSALVDYLGTLDDVAPAGAGRKTRAKAAQALLDKVQLVRDPERRTSDNVRKSRGFAFVTFKDHKWAMGALQHLNNNPSVFGGKLRPIVEFAIEDKRKLQMQKELYERHGHKLKVLGDDNGDAPKKKHKKHVESRGRKQREKRRALKSLKEAEDQEKEKRRAVKQKEVVEQKKAEAREGLMEVKKRKAAEIPDARQSEMSASKRFKKQPVATGQLEDDFELRAMQRFREAGLA